MNNYSQKFVADLASFYNEPGKLGGQKNIKLQILESYIQEHFKIEQYEKLFGLITSNYKQYDNNPGFPTPAHVKEIWEKYNKEYTINEQTEKTRKMLSDTFGQPKQIEFNIPISETDIKSNATNKEMLIDEYSLNSGEMISKYGIKRCTEFWKVCGENWEKFMQGNFKREKTNFERGVKYD